MIARIQVRRDTYDNWYNNNPVLSNGEIGYDETTEKFKVGDNTTAWRDLPYELGQWKSDASGNLSFGNQTQTLSGQSHAGTPLAEGNVTIHNNLTVEGDFTVNGTTTTINTEEVTIEDNMVILNSNLTGTPPSSLDAGIEVNLGSSPSRKFYWDQATLKWTLDADVNVLGDIYSNGTALWRLNSNDIYFTGGNVGIGTNSPATSLHILETGTDAATLRLANSETLVSTNQVIGSIEFETADSTVGSTGLLGKIDVLCQDATPDSAMRFFTTQNDTGTQDFSERMRISNIGNVGIGTPSPQARLSVTRGNDSIELDHITSPDTNRILSYDRTADVELPLKIRGSLLTFDTAATERIRILNNGNVGINTNAPDTKLHIDSNTSIGNETLLKLERPLGYGNTGFNQYYNQAVGSDPVLWGLNFGLAVGTDTDGKVGIKFESTTGTTTTSDKIFFRTAGSNQVLIDNDGNVGIGTTGPSSKLHINGSSGVFAKITDSASSGTVETGLVLERSSANTDYRVLNNGTFRVQTATDASTWTDIMTITSAGNVNFLGDVTSNGSAVGVWTPNGNDIYYNTGKVGIGTSSPGATLDVSVPSNGTIGTLYTTTREYNDSTNRVDLLFKYKFNSNGDYTNGSQISLTKESTSDGHYGSDIRLWTRQDGVASSEKMRIKGDGKVGIGTDNPDGRLHVKSSGTGAENVAAFGNANINSGLYIRTDDGNLEWGLATLNQRDLIFETNDIRRMTIDGATGKVGINNTNPSEFLDVVGNITATGTITSSSDITLKENIELISDPIDKVKEISGYTFNKKGEDLRLVGLIAQEVEKVLPEAVAENNEGLKSVAYGNLVALLVECVKKQDERIDQLEETIKKLK